MFFDSCKDLKEVKSLYRKLALENHPDRGGDEKLMTQINAEYEAACNRLKSGDVKKDGDPQAFREVMSVLAGLDGIEVELCGDWLWISGDTKPVKEELKKAGCKWASKKRLWYWHSGNYRLHNRKEQDMDTIRAKYGSRKMRAGRMALN